MKIALALVCGVLPLFSAVADYSKEDVVIEHFNCDITVHADGSYHIVRSSTLRVQTDAGVRAAGVLSWPYDQSNDRLEIEYIRVRKPNGSVVNTSPSAIQDVTSEISREAPMYSDTHEKQVPVQSLAAGDLLEYRVISDSTPRIRGQFWDATNFLHGDVVLDESWTYHFPSNMPVRYDGRAAQPEITNAGAERTFTWRHQELVASVKQAEEDAKRGDTDPHADFSLTTFSSWAEVGRWYNDLQRERIAVTPAIQQKAAQLTAGLTDRRAKEEAIYRFASTQFRYVGIWFGIGRFQPHAADQVLSNGFGDCKDKHTLFAALLKAAGVESYPALVGPLHSLEKELPSPAAFNHVITVIPENNSYLWLDTTPEVAPFGAITVLDTDALVIPSNGEAKIVHTPEVSPVHGPEILDGDGELDNQGTYAAHYTLRTRSVDEILLRSAFHSLPFSNREQAVKNIVASMGFAGDVSDPQVSNPEDTSTPFEIQFKYRREKLGNWDSLQIPVEVFPAVLLIPDEKKIYTQEFRLGEPSEYRYSCRIRLAPGMTATPLDKVSVEDAYFSFEESCSVDNSVLTCQRDLTIKKSAVPTRDLKVFASDAKKISDAQSRMIQLAQSSKTQTAATSAADKKAAALMEDARNAL